MPHPLHILYTSSNMPWQGGGTFYRAFGFARQLALRGHTVTLLLTSLNHKLRFVEEMVDGVHLVHSPALLSGKLRSGWDPYEVARRIRWLRGRHFDLIHAFESRPVVIHPALSAQKHTSACLVLDWCDWLGRGGLIEERSGLTKLLLRPVETYYEEHFRHRAHATTVINSSLRERAIDLGIPAQSIHWLPNGAEIDRLKVLDRNLVRQALGLDTSAPFIGYLGQAFPSDARLMAQAFKQVKEAVPDSRLVLIGNYKNNITPYIDDLSAIMETGFVQDLGLNQYLAACDILWLPLKNTLANRGRWPMKLSDYMSSGRAVVSTNVGDWVEWFRGQHPIGVLADDEPVDFAQKTLSLLADEAARHEYGQHARHLAETVFNWALVASKLESFYYNLVK